MCINIDDIHEGDLKVMSKGLRDLKPKNILLGIVAPLIVFLVIIWFPLSERWFASLGKKNDPTNEKKGKSEPICLHSGSMQKPIRSKSLAARKQSQNIL